jgi:hypothetical protein
MARTPQTSRYRASNLVATNLETIPCWTAVGFFSLHSSNDKQHANGCYSVVVDEVAGKEGVAAGFDPEINNVVNEVANKYL